MAALLSLDNINQNIRRLEYAVRGPLVIRAVELARELEAGVEKPFKSVIRANIGDCHAMGQKPLTFYRQMVACASQPELLEGPAVPEDVRARVRALLAGCGGQSVGSYSDSCGLELVRRQCAQYIEQRDGMEPEGEHWRDIFLTYGASEVVKTMLAFLNHAQGPGKQAGVMVPIPQYPLYSATLSELGMSQVGYYLNEERDWCLELEELERAYGEASGHCDIRALVVINPANPTGSVLSRENICQVIEFARKHRLLLIADEVYQHNVWAEGAQFHSFKKCMRQLGGPQTELVSMMSASKGYMGECGLRGGYGELSNFAPDVQACFYKLLSSRLCSSVLGQVAVSCVVNPPRPGEPSHPLFQLERDRVLAELRAKARLVADTFNSVEGVHCNPVAGAMYAFPRLQLPARLLEAAAELNQPADFFYLRALLEEAGVCVVPGSGFGQRPGTFHFRTTILPPPEVFADMMDRFKRFHAAFIARYS